MPPYVLTPPRFSGYFMPMLLSSLAVCIQEVWFQKRKLKLKEMPTLLRPRVQPAASLQPAAFLLWSSSTEGMERCV